MLDGCMAGRADGQSTSLGLKGTQKQREKVICAGFQCLLPSSGLAGRLESPLWQVENVYVAVYYSSFPMTFKP